ncbi:MAG: alcohol dehydrogenase catalytic domain-containing protein [Hyphomonadaceae bacterium]
MVVGHEFVGEIVEVGDNVNDYKPGMIVSGEGHIVCGRCRNCMAGRRHLCPYTSGVGVNRPGCFAEYIVIPNANVWHHHDGIDLDIASIFDPYGNATHTALQWDMVGEDVLITSARARSARWRRQSRNTSAPATSSSPTSTIIAWRWPRNLARRVRSTFRRRR